MIGAPSAPALRDAITFAAGEFAARRTRRSNAFDEAVAWRELVACVVGSATRYEHALGATEVICALLPAPWAMSDIDWEDLRIKLGDGTVRLPTRFPREHGRYLVAAVESLYRDGIGLTPWVTTQSPAVIRRDLVARLPGVGPKQASLLLLNLGVTDDMAVLDRHVLRYLSWIGLLATRRPPRSLAEYEETEAIFRTHSAGLGHAIVDVDRAVWLTLRVWNEVAH